MSPKQVKLALVIGLTAAVASVLSEFFLKPGFKGTFKP